MNPTRKLATLLFCLSLLPLRAQTAPSTLHVSRSSTVTYPGHGAFLRLFGTVNGQKVELESESSVSGITNSHPVVLEPGDYPIVNTDDKKVDGGIRRIYELQLSDGKHAKYTLVGLSE